MTGREYSIKGVVETGNRLGRTIGVPTANILPDSPDRVLPPLGAYVSEVIVPGCGRLRGVTNIGLRPTIDPELRIPQPIVETHIIDFDDDIYGSEIEVMLLHFLRPERKFYSLD